MTSQSAPLAQVLQSESENRPLIRYLFDKIMLNYYYPAILLKKMRIFALEFTEWTKRSKRLKIQATGGCLPLSNQTAFRMP